MSQASSPSGCLVPEPTNEVLVARLVLDHVVVIVGPEEQHDIPTLVGVEGAGGSDSGWVTDGCAVRGRLLDG